MKVKTRKLIKVWFKKLYGVALASEPGMVSPGGASFSQGYYVGMDVAGGWVILRLGTRMQKRDNLTLFHFENGLTCCVSNRLINKIERVRLSVPVEPLMREDLAVVRFNIPLENSQRIIEFLLAHNALVLDRVGRRNKAFMKKGEESEIAIVTHKVLIKKSDLKKFLNEFFKAKLTPPGREWMVLHSTPTTESVKAFRETL